MPIRAFGYTRRAEKRLKRRYFNTPLPRGGRHLLCTLAVHDFFFMLGRIDHRTRGDRVSLWVCRVG
jgi:hypothetical protein